MERQGRWARDPWPDITVALISGAVFVVVAAVWFANLFSHVHRFGAQ